MITISQKDINRDLEIYLESKSRPSFPEPRKVEPVLQAKDADKEFESEEKEFYSERQPWHKRMAYIVFGKQHVKKYVNPKTKEEELEKEFDETEEVKKPKRGAFSSIFDWLFIDKEEDETEGFEEESNAPEESQIPEDIKEALKIQHKWLEKLSAKRIKEFKESDDYSNYRLILEKYKLIR
ncbi:hypothetical protein JW930_03065 [Candidatus Woesearchaeota archaeon]|nr:hypothetical protein [Candidatus Woesearchaeota archaeon]